MISPTNVRLTEENVKDYAETLVRQVFAGGQILDYSEGSLITLEDLLRNSDALLQAPEISEMQRSLVVFYNGCYLGEVMARQLGGVWRFEENWADSSLVFAYGEGGVQIHPFLKIWRRVTEGPEDNDLVSYYTILKERLADDAS